MTDLLGIVGGRKHLPVIIAGEIAECGIACLAMIARFHGHSIDLNGLRQRVSTSLSGTTLRSLMEVADQLSLSSRALSVDLGNLQGLRLPAILHWKFNHFVVLESVRRNRAVIHDPALGKRTVSLRELSNNFTGVCLEITPIKPFEKIEARAKIQIKSLWSSMRGFWTAASQLLVLSVVVQLTVLAMPFQLQLIIDDVLSGGSADLLVVIAVAFGGLVVLQTVLQALREWTAQIVTSLMSYQMTGNLVHHLMRLPSTYFERRHVGDILSRMGSSATVREILSNTIVSTTLDLFTVAAVLLALVFYSPPLTIVVVISVLLSLAVSAAFYPSIRAKQEERLFASAEEQSLLMENIRAATTIKLMGREAERESEWRNHFARATNAAQISQQRSTIAKALQTAIFGLQNTLVIAMGAQLVLSAQGMSIGMLVAFLSYQQTFTSRIGSLITQLTQYRLLQLHLERLSDIVVVNPEPSAGGNDGAEIQGRITLRNVCFRYGMSDAAVFNNINLDILPGEYLAVVGPSGGGKTTLLKLILGLLQPTSGEILLDGSPATPELWRSWRRQMGVVAQDDRLLSGTLAENIAFFDPDLDMEAVVRAAKSARIHDEIEAKPMRYRSLVGDMGAALSGGQRQRILLARALYREPKILVLDEGTANLDEQTEAALSDLVSTMPVTRIVVTHRAALVTRADRVVGASGGDLNLKVGRAHADIGGHLSRA